MSTPPKVPPPDANDQNGTDPPRWFKAFGGECPPPSISSYAIIRDALKTSAKAVAEGRKRLKWTIEWTESKSEREAAKRK